jgi:hypothetical protein
MQNECTAAAAVGQVAQRGLASFHRSADWAEVGREYREVLLVTSGAASRSGKVVLDPEEIRRELKRLRGLPALGDLATMRDLRVDVVG